MTNKLWSELLTGVKITLQYVLSHHEKDKYYKCYRIGKVHFCSRCVGVFMGLMLGLATFDSFSSLLTMLGILLLPSVALIDWSFTSFKNTTGFNFVRTLSGVLLGFAFVLAISHVRANALLVISIAAMYIVVAMKLLYAQGRFTSSYQKN